MSRLLQPPLALYVHLPWCVRKCPYCDFNSHAIDGPVPEQRYVAALLADLDAQRAAYGLDQPLLSVFIGGGTPSLFSPEAIAQLLAGVRERFPEPAPAEITMEANPGTIERGRFAGYRDAGVTRVSLGGQSFDARHLAALGRIHSADETARAAEELHAAGLANFNIDLMYGLPAQTVAEALADIERALGLAPAHLSHYQLTLEPGTVFFHRPPALPDEDTTWEMQVACQARLAAAGFGQYEISAYARRGSRCTHNLNYWRFGDYVGIGAGAHGKLTRPDRGEILRTEHVRQPRQYMERMETARPLPETRSVTPADLPFEFMLNGLRLIEGVDLRCFQSRTGLGPEALAPSLGIALERGLLEEAGAEAWRPTALGLRFLNDLQALFLAPQAALQGGPPVAETAKSHRSGT